MSAMNLSLAAHSTHGRSLLGYPEAPRYGRRDSLPSEDFVTQISVDVGGLGELSCVLGSMPIVRSHPHGLERPDRP